MRLRHLLFALLLPLLGNSQTVVDIIVNSPDHTILEEAVIAADLQDALAGDGPFTVFAPTDDAFAALPPGTLDQLLEDPSGALTQILLYHVASGNVGSGALSDGQVITTLNGASVTVDLSMGVRINNALVTLADLPATNGVVHVIDAVLLPPAPQSVVDVIVNSPVHNTLEAAVIAADLAGTLSGDGPFTVFAPTDDAFAALPAGTVEALLGDPSGALTDVLLYHVLGEDLLAEGVINSTGAQTLNRKGVDFTVNDNGEVFVENAQIIVADITTPNGTVHVIDAVLVPNFSIMDVIEDSDAHNTLEAAIDAARFTVPLHSNDVQLTIFAPTDAAFAALPAGTVETLLMDPTGALSDILLFHLVDGRVLSGDLTDGLVVTTITGKQALVTIENDNVFIDGVQVTMANIETDNGVVHVVDAVIIPPFTMNDVVRNSPDHTLLEQLLLISGLDQTLNGDGDLTLVAPTDAAVVALGQATIDVLLANPALLQNILLYHVGSEGSIESTDIDGRLIAATPIGLDLLFSEDGTNVTVNNAATVTVANLMTDNGIVHVIDAVLIPSTITSTVAANPPFSTLNTALEASGLDATLGSADNRFTVFAPTNAAFDALPAGVLQSLLDDPTGALAQVLTYHAVEGRAFSDELSDGQTVMTVNGEDVTVTIDNGLVFINDAQVTQFDFFVGNGLIHVIDAVLTEPTNTVVDIIINSPDHTTLEAAVVAAGLVETLSGEGPFTVFAPNDDAFNNLPDGLVAELLQDPTGDLTTILTYHVVGSEVLSASLNDGDTAPTLQGESVNVTINTDGLFINDAQVLTEDIPADNGIVHVISEVLLPAAYVSTEETLPATAVTVSPTLVRNNVTFTFESDVLGASTVYIFDAMGKLVYTEYGVTSGTTIDVSQLSVGAYYVTLTDGEKATTKKITKQ